MHISVEEYSGIWKAWEGPKPKSNFHHLGGREEQGQRFVSKRRKITKNRLFYSATRSERKEFGLVKDLYKRGSCVRKGLYESFVVENPTGAKGQELP